MEVGSDTFPRDEVTGLAAFEHLDPVSTVSTLNVMPEPPAPAPRVLTPPPPPPTAGRASLSARPRTGSTLPPPPPAAARVFSKPPQASAVNVSVPPPAALPRIDDTEIISAAEAEEDVGPSWEDPDEAATRVQAASPAAELHMDWDDEEPPTQMRGEAGAHNTGAGVSVDWNDENLETRVRADYEPHDVTDTAAYQPAGESGRPSPFPTRRSIGPVGYAPPSQAPAAHEIVRPGAPSPFGTTAADTAWGQDLRGGRRSHLWLAAAAVAIVAVGFGLRALFAKETPGLVTLATVPADARVLVDGKPVLGTSSPWSATDLTPGVAHELVVQKDGYAEQRATFTLEEGEAKTLPAVTLAATAKEVGFALSSAPSGAQILVDGKAIGLSTPARVTDITPGLHKVTLVREGYASYELQVFVPETQVLELPEVTLGEGGAKAEKAEKAESEPTKVASADETSRPRARATSARERRQERRAARRAKRAAAAASVATPRVAAAPRTAIKVGPRAATTAAPAAGKGVLRVNSRPWAQVFVDGRMVGNTPQMGIQLAAGKHTIKLSNPQMGLSKTFTLSVKSGQTVTKVMNLIE